MKAWLWATAIGALALLLGGCSQTTQPPPPPQGPHALSGQVVSENAGGPVVGSEVRLFLNGQQVAVTTTDAQGRFSFTNLPEGTYRVVAQKPGMAGSVAEGVRVPEMASIWLIQREAFQTSYATTPPALRITDHDGNPLEEGTFTNAIPFRIQVEPNSNYIRPIRYIYVGLGRTPGSAFLYNTPTSSRLIFIETEDSGNQTLSGTAVAGFGSASGERVYLHVVAYDFNNNRVLYLVPITFVNSNTAQQDSVQPPTDVAATAITLGDAVGFYQNPTPLSLQVPYGRGQMGSLTLEPQAAPEGSNLYVEVRWCYTATPAPFAFVIERSTDGQNWTPVGRVGGGRNDSCPANNFNRPFFFRDNSPDLEVGQTYYYRVVAVGSNQAPSTPSRTTPLPRFFAPLLAPADESVGVSLTPNFVIGHPQLATGADGAGYNLVLWDTLTGDSVSWQTLGGYTLLVEFGTGEEGNGIPQGEALVYGFHPIQNRIVFFTDTAGLLDPSRPNTVPVDVAQGKVTLPYNFDGLAQLPQLQTLRTYAWQLFVSYAYRYEDGRVSAYSIQTWPSSTSFIRISRPGTQVFEFTTGER